MPHQLLRGDHLAEAVVVRHLAHDGDVEVAIDVPEGRIGVFHPKQPVVVEIWARDNARMPGVVRELGPDWLLFDFNHPLASQPVTFEVLVIGVL